MHKNMQPTRQTPYQNYNMFHNKASPFQSPPHTSLYPMTYTKSKPGRPWPSQSLLNGLYDHSENRSEFDIFMEQCMDLWRQVSLALGLRHDPFTLEDEESLRFAAGRELMRKAQYRGR